MTERTRAYKFYSARWGLDALYRRRLKISTDVDINDPFEFLATGPGKVSRKSARRIRKQLFAETGIISFCKTWREPLLWSHYAENHQGVALGFDLLPMIGFEVEYTKKRIELPANNNEIPIFGERLEFWRRIKRLKSASWSYEQEVRVFPSITASIYENGLYFRPFDQIGELKEVIIGAEFKSVGNIELAKDLESQGVNIVTARLAFEDFSVVKQNKRRLQKRL